MTPEKTANIIQHTLGETTEGHFVIAFHPSGEVIIRQSIPDAKTCLAINSVLMAIVTRGGLMPCENSANEQSH